jgi:hypothetical protein
MTAVAMGATDAVYAPLTEFGHDIRANQFRCRRGRGFFAPGLFARAGNGRSRRGISLGAIVVSSLRKAQRPLGLPPL